MSAKEITLDPKDELQAKAIREFKNNDILILLGPAGSGKTHLATALALSYVLPRKYQIKLSRPTVTAREELGFLPGKLEAKMMPFLLPFTDVLKNISHIKPEEFFKSYCEVTPLAYMRGRTFDCCAALLDEAQNCDYEQLKLFITRIGKNGKMIITGDLRQSDRVDSGLGLLVDNLSNLSGVGIVELSSESNPRHPLIPRLLSRL